MGGRGSSSASSAADRGFSEWLGFSDVSVSFTDEVTVTTERGPFGEVRSYGIKAGLASLPDEFRGTVANGKLSLRSGQLSRMGFDVEVKSREGDEDWQLARFTARRRR